MAKGHTCHAIGCRALVLPDELFCERHDRMLQSDIRTILGRKFRPRAKKQSKVFELTMTRALDEILYAQMSGHRMLRATSFQFSDDGKELPDA